jgi:hypothetical protein
MNIVEVRNSLRRLSVPRRSAEREGSDRRQLDRRQEDIEARMAEVNDGASKKYVRVNVTPGERTLLQDMYLMDDE